MPYTIITKPTVGDTTRKSLADALIDNDAYLYSLVSALQSQFVPNGSFELDADSNGIPDQWTRSLYTGGSQSLDTAARHGLKSCKFTSPGGAGNGGGYLETSDFFDVSPELSYELTWHFKSDVAGVHNVVEIRWYDSAQSYLSSATLWDSATANPILWIAIDRQAIPPTTARFGKIRLVGCKNDDTTAGSTWFDGVTLKEKRWFTRCDFLTPGVWRWVCPTGVTTVMVEVYGSGGGGGNTDDDAGGGGGGYARKVESVVAGTAYTVQVGAGGAAGNPGSTGSASIWNAAVTANGGAGGNQATGGAGGTATGGDVNETGGDGNSVSGGYGGTSHNGGRTTNNTVGTWVAGPVIGAGGAGAGPGGGNGGAGASGAVFIHF